MVYYEMQQLIVVTLSTGIVFRLNTQSMKFARGKLKWQIIKKVKELQ